MFFKILVVVLLFDIATSLNQISEKISKNTEATYCCIEKVKEIRGVIK